MLIGTAAVHTAWESEEKGVGPSCWDLGHHYAAQSAHQDRFVLQRHLLPQAQLTMTVRTPREDISS